MYGPPGDPGIIAASIYGETRKVDFLFVLGGDETFVRHTVSHYSGPLRPGVSVSSTVTSEFAVCAGQPPAYPGSTHVTAYEEAAKTLALILSVLSR